MGVHAKLTRNDQKKFIFLKSPLYTIWYLHYPKFEQRAADGSRELDDLRFFQCLLLQKMERKESHSCDIWQCTRFVHCKGLGDRK